MDKPVTLASINDRVVYVSGPTDTTDAEYADARAWLRAHGARHVTTANRLVDGSLAPEQQIRERIHELTKRDYDAHEGALVRRPWYDVVVVLEGWFDNKVCLLEAEVAWASDIVVIALNVLKEAYKLEEDAHRLKGAHE